MVKKYFLIFICLVVFSCKKNNYEYITKDETFRDSISTGFFTELSHGYTYYEINNRKSENVLVFIHGYSVPSYIWDKTYNSAKEKGFKDVYHLKGGILKYLETMPKNQSLWEGDCFVFDYRVAVNHDLKPALWKIDPDTNLPERMNPLEVDKIAERRRSGAIFKKPYTF